ncbi:MAG: PD-(D/E)XK nuclease domain-containing protein, partial [bacterium]|nr:PD-(D/E)XK nuclease domain-containing protein [bacterium]
QYHDTTSVRSLIEGERNLQGFMNALLTLNPYYLTCPEVELNHGYCDFFLMPDLERYPDIRHSYIIELKYLPMTATQTEADKQWHEAVEQIRGYAQGQVVHRMIGKTQLHLLIAQLKGYDLLKLDQVELSLS